jgi:hypothetical protein
MSWTAKGSGLLEKRDFYLLQNIKTSSGAHPASYSLDTRGKAARNIKLTTHLHLVLRL